VDKQIFGPGHNSFTVAEDGVTPICVYHARDYEHAEGDPSVVPNTDTRPLAQIIKDPLYDPNRHARTLAVSFDESGRPLFNLY
ncbi:MAG: alpha-N-arabinofuranosidase, partial [Shewanella xiamenensis]|nr:alpha-N-arabinofuranosidase [Shewanella xiamenensis]